MNIEDYLDKRRQTDYVLTGHIICECRTKHKEIDPPILKVIEDEDKEGFLKLKCLCGRQIETSMFKRNQPDFDEFDSIY